MKLTLLPIVGCMLLVSLPASAELQGVKLYEQGKYARASKSLERELRSPKLPKQERGKARLYLAAALYASGAEESARSQLEELALTEPSLKVDPVLFPEGFVTLAEQSFERVAARKAAEANPAPSPKPPAAPPGQAEELARLERQKAEAQAARPPAPVAEQPAPAVAPEQPERPEEARTERTVRLSPQVFGFIDPLGKAFGAGGGLTLGLGSVELGARVLLGKALGVGVEAGVVLGTARVQPRLALRGTAVPSLSSYGGGAVAGLRLHASSRLTFLVDLGAEYFAAREGYRALTVTNSAGLGFDLL